MTLGGDSDEDIELSAYIVGPGFKCVTGSALYEVLLPFVLHPSLQISSPPSSTSFCSVYQPSLFSFAVSALCSISALDRRVHKFDAAPTE